MSSASLISLSLKPCPSSSRCLRSIDNVKNDCDALPACLEIWSQFCLGDLLYGDKAESAFDQFLSTLQGRQAVPGRSCVRYLSRRNKRRILLLP